MSIKARLRMSQEHLALAALERPGTDPVYGEADTRRAHGRRSIFGTKVSRPPSCRTSPVTTGEALVAGCDSYAEKPLIASPTNLTPNTTRRTVWMAALFAAIHVFTWPNSCCERLPRAK